MNWLAIGSVIALACSIGLTLNFAIVILLAMLHGGKVTLVFNKFHEGWFEVVLCFLTFFLSSAGLLYLSLTYYIQHVK